MGHDGANNYRMSFSTGGLFINESICLAEIYLNCKSWDEAIADAREDNLMQFRSSASSERTVREIATRLRSLYPDELEILVGGNRQEQASVVWLAVCRTYQFISEFAVEVIGERYATYQYNLSHAEFDVFFHDKAEWNDDLRELADSTRKKLRQVLFRFMREAEILSDDGRIIGAVLSVRLRELISSLDPNELRYFPGSQKGLN